MMQYATISKWTGLWLGGWGSERDISALLNKHAADGWRLVRSENSVFFWMWFWPRHKVLLILEREAPAGTTAETDVEISGEAP